MHSTSVERQQCRARLALLSISTALCSGLALPSFALTMPTVISPLKVEQDHNGVNIATGKMALAAA